MENCECTAKDFECDINYYREARSDTCTRVADAVEEEDACAAGDSYYTIPTGYRRVAGNTCTGGVSHSLEPATLHCKTGWSIALYYILALGFAAGLGYVIYTQKETFEELVGKVFLKHE